MKRMTRLLSLVAPLLAATAAQAQVKVAEGVEHAGGLFSSLDYGFSEQNQRAWVVLHYAHEGPCADSEGTCKLDDPVQVRVPGLSYDASRRQVVYQADGAEPVVCARLVSHRTFFGGREDRLDPTGQCRAQVATFRRFVDDGFAGHEDRGEEIDFNPAARGGVDGA